MRDLAFLPRAAMADTRLSRNDLAVLAALCGFYRHRQPPRKHPTRSVIRELTGISDERQVSRSTSKLLASGWITKQGVGGRFGAAVYSINWENNPVIPDRDSRLNNPVNLDRVIGNENPVISDTDTGRGVNSDRGSGGNPVGIVTHINTPEREEKDKEALLSESGSRARVPTGFGLGEVLQLMVDAGMPMAFSTNAADRTMMAGWISTYTEQQIRNAIEKGGRVKGAERGGTPLGPRYVNVILEKGSAARTADDIGAEWLAEHRAQAGNG